MLVLDELSLQESVQRAVCRTAAPDVLCLGPPGTVRFCQDSVPATARRYAAATASYAKQCSVHDATNGHIAFYRVTASLKIRAGTLPYNMTYPFLIHHSQCSCHSTLDHMFS